MGSSAAATLSYGHAYDESNIFVDLIPEELSDKISDFEAQVAYLLEGLIPPEGDWEDDAYKAVYRVYADKRRAIDKDCKLQIVHYGDMSYWSSVVLSIKDSVHGEYSMITELDELPAHYSEWDDQFAEFFEATGLEPVKISWVLSAIND